MAIHVRRRLFTILSAVSLVLCAAALAGRILSHWIDQGVRYQHGGTTYFAQSVDGVLLAGRAELGEGFTMNIPQGMGCWSGQQHMFSRLFFPEEPTTLNKYGLGLYTEPMISAGVLMVPHWLAAAVLAVLPALWLRRMMRERRARRLREHGLCPTCGYDLRASGERCPECGQAISAKEPVA